MLPSGGVSPRLAFSGSPWEWDQPLEEEPAAAVYSTGDSGLSFVQGGLLGEVMAEPIRCPHCGSYSTPGPGGPAPARCERCGGLLETPHPEETAETAPCRTPCAPTPLVAPALAVRGFRLLGEIGRGGMGLVYRAVQLSLGREVALKVLPPLLAADPQRLERFRREASLVADLKDAHILPVYDLLDAEGVPVLVMPF